MDKVSDVDPSAPVVVGCDGSAGSEFTIRFGIQEARRRQTSLLILTAFERPIDPDIDSFDVPEDQLKRRVQRRAEAFEQSEPVLLDTSKEASVDEDLQAEDTRSPGVASLRTFTAPAEVDQVLRDTGPNPGRSSWRASRDP